MINSHPIQLPEDIEDNHDIVLFDGVCVICTRWARFLLRFDKAAHFKLCSVQSDKGTRILATAGLPTTYYETLVLVKDGKIYTQSSAIILVLSQLPAPWKWARIFSLIPKGLLDPTYHFIATRRYRFFGKHDQCYLPSEKDKARFL
jgi:predicted DCC family thiol-disulfide oxidoreductase YuxK